MRRVEEKLIHYLKGTGRKIHEKEIHNFAAKDSNGTLDSLFSAIHYGIDSTTGEHSLDKVCELIHYVKVIIENYDDVSRGIVDRKLAKMDEKISRVLLEKKQSFKNTERATSELEKIRSYIEEILYHTNMKNSKQFDFMNYLIESIKNIDYIDFAIEKVPSLVNVKDKDGKILLQYVIERYCETMKEGLDQENYYYFNLISLILTRTNFVMSRKEKRACLESIYHAMDSFYSEKGKVNIKSIQELKELVEMIKKYDEQAINIPQLANKYHVSVFFSGKIENQVKLLKPISKQNRKTVAEEIVTDEHSIEMTRPDDQYHISLIFSDDIKNHIELLPVVHDLKRKRVAERIITIDKGSALVLDDGFSCRRLDNGNYLLGIHSASVLGYFPYHSMVVDEAITRNQTKYLPIEYQNKKHDFNQMISIFPYSFAVQKASLVPNEDRYARSYFFEISSDGEIVKEYFLPSIIQSNKKLSFHDVNDILKKGSNESEIQDIVLSLQEVDNLLGKRYKKVEFYDQLKEQQGDISCLSESNMKAQKIVYDNILLLGDRVASYFASNEYPCLYRVLQKSEDYKEVQKMVKSFPKNYGNDQYRKLASSLKRIYPTARYALSGSHDGMHLDHYCCCASSLRKGASIVMEHCLEVCYDSNPTDFQLVQLENELQKRADQLNASQYPLEWFLRDCEKVYRKDR